MAEKQKELRKAIYKMEPTQKILDLTSEVESFERALTVIDELEAFYNESPSAE